MSKNIYNYDKNKYKPRENSKITYDIAILEITNLGKDFIEVCTR